VLSFALRYERIRKIHELKNRSNFLSSISQTFHGRDVFSPVAAHVANGVPVQKLGPRREDFVRVNWPEPRFGKNWVQGHVVYIDQFGNAITNLDAEALQDVQPAVCEIRG